ncbi:MFS transporter [Colwellia sp. MEBiC06753]
MSNSSVQTSLCSNSLSTGFAQMKVSPNSILAQIMLAFLTTAGIFYINIMPALLSGLKEGLGYTSQQAGFVSSANLYGASIGALLAVFIIKKIRWQRWAYCLLVSILVIDFCSIYISSVNAMIMLRALHGITGGLLVGIGFCIISRTQDPDKTFGYLLFIQWGLGGLGLMYLPGLVPVYGTTVLFSALIAFTLVTLVMLLFLPHYPVEDILHAASSKGKTKLKPLFMTLSAIFLFQAANMGLFAYIIALGKAEGLTTSFMSTSLGIASWVALLGAFLVMILGTKYGRVMPLMIGVFVITLCTWILHFSEITYVYLYANIIIGIAWAFVLPYLFGMCSELDKAGQYAAMGGFASKMGLASGPMVGALLLNNEVYGPMINVATVGLIVCGLIAFLPAKQLDSK